MCICMHASICVRARVHKSGYGLCLHTRGRSLSAALWCCLPVSVHVCVRAHTYVTLKCFTSRYITLHFTLYTFIHTCLHLSFYPSMYLSICQSIYLSIDLSIYLFISICIYAVGLESGQTWPILRLNPGQGRVKILAMCFHATFPRVPAFMQCRQQRFHGALLIFWGCFFGIFLTGFVVENLLFLSLSIKRSVFCFSLWSPPFLEG